VASLPLYRGIAENMTDNLARQTNHRQILAARE
jgi:hypothetical protein